MMKIREYKSKLSNHIYGKNSDDLDEKVKNGLKSNSFDDNNGTDGVYFHDQVNFDDDVYLDIDFQ